MRSQIESGAELLARLNGKPSLCGLENTLFLEGPRNTDVIEIGGEQSTGKTLLLSQMIAKCILPNYNRIEGCNASAILINTDHHFQITKLVESMSNIIDAAHAVSFTSKPLETNFNKMTVIKNSLNNLHVINCYESEQFSLTLRTLDNMFLDNVKIALLAIDSITAYYWQDHENNVAATIDAYIRKLLKLIKIHTTRFNVATIYTRPYEKVYYKKKKFTTNVFTSDVDYKLQLCRTHNSENFTCILKTVQAIKKIHYSILSNGIRWRTDEGEE